MKQFNWKSIVGCLLCVGILFLGLSSSDTQSRLSADDIAAKKAEVDRADTLVKQLAQSLHDQATINKSLTEADNRTIEVIENLQASIVRLGEHVRDSVPTRDEVVRLVSTEADATKQDGECTCGEKLADLQKQIDELKAKVASLECAPARTSAGAASSYGTISSPVIVSSGGSTGSVVASYGSTGSSVSYGSKGSVYRSSPVQYSYSQPVYSQPVVSQAVVTTSDCYIDANGNQVCPQQRAVQQSPGLFPRLRRLGN